jgi:hypothetical protein
MTKENSKISGKLVRFVGCSLLVASLVGGIALYDSKIDCEKDISIVDEILGPQQLMDEFSDGKYFVYQKMDIVMNLRRYDSNVDRPILNREDTYDEKLNVSYNPQKIVVEIISKKDSLDGWMKMGVYVPNENDKIFIYRKPSNDLIDFERYDGENFFGRIEYGNYHKGNFNSTDEYVGILDENTYERYKDLIDFEFIFSPSYLDYEPIEKKLGMTN